MRPEKLTLRNIGPFRGTHSVNFAELGSIFLIYGKTGAGKTTLFDALTYAFYSDAPGGRKGLSRQMRSHFADDEEESVVELEFSLAGKRWRIRRTLPYDTIGVRSGKKKSVPEEVSLEFSGPEGWLNKTSTNKSETDRAILSLIGLSQEEFCRIVLLPQGEFAQFLKQNSTERKAVLAKLFPVSQYERVTNLARERAREVGAQLAETEKNIVALTSRFNRLSYDLDRKAIADRVESLRSDQAAFRREIGIKSALLQEARAVADKRATLRLIEERLTVLAAEAPLIERKRLSLQAARAAEPLLVRLSQLREKKLQDAAARVDLDTLHAEIASRKDALAKLEALTPAITASKKEKESLLLRREQLRVASEIASALETETNVHAETRKKLTGLKKDAERIKLDIRELDGRIVQLSVDRSELDNRTGAAESARESLERARAAKDLATEGEELRKARDAHQGAVANLREQIIQETADLKIARAEKAALEGEADIRGKASLAHSLAAELKPGTACPVCGSLDHPHPATTGDLGDFTLTERIEAAQRRVEQAETRLSGLDKRLAGGESDLRNAESRYSVIADKYRSTLIDARRPTDADTDLPSAESAATTLRLAAEAMQKASDALNRSRLALRETDELSRKKASLEKHLAELKDEQAAVEAAEAAQKAGIEHKKERYREAFPDGSIPEDASDALERCAARILEIEAALNSHEEQLTEERDRLSAQTGKKVSLEKQIETLSGQLESEQKAFDADRTQAGFADEEAVRQAGDFAATRKETEAAITAFGEELAVKETARSQLAAEISRWTGPDPELAAAEIALLDERVTGNDQALEEENARLAALDSLKARSDELETERQERSLANGRLASLAADLTGNNPLKTSFDAWILGMYLEEITAYANTRLERMSEGRYRIQLNESYRKGNSLSGLDLEIQDAYTGRTRPSGTLSGGETFMTSISLALGLADSIQSRSGGIQLDAVFIDEGFGSLDDASLERAITILDEIRGSRMVGLISHVAELRSRIPSRIEIVKTGAGSTIQKEA